MKIERGRPGRSGHHPTNASADDAARAEYVRRLVDSFPPLSDERKAVLGPLLRPGVIAMWKAKRERERAAD